MGPKLTGEDIIAEIPGLRAYALVRTRSAHLADDLVQDTLERAWRARETFQDGASLKGWLITILRNRLIDVYRGRGPVTEDIDGDQAAKLASAPQQLWRLQYIDLLAAIDQLPPAQMEAVRLIWIAGLTMEEAAAVLGRPLPTVKKLDSQSARTAQRH